MSEDPTPYTPTVIADDLSVSALAPTLATLDAIDKTLAIVGKRIPHGIADAPRGLTAHGRTIAAALTRLQAAVVEAQVAIPLLEARRDALDAAVKTAALASKQPAVVQERVRCEREMGTISLQIAEARRLLADLTTF